MVVRLGVSVIPVSEGNRHITGGNRGKENDSDLPGVSGRPALHPRPFARLAIGQMTRIGIDQVHSTVRLDHTPPKKNSTAARVAARWRRRNRPLGVIIFQSLNS